MSSAQVGVVLRHIRQLTAARKDPELPDHQLLERFARQKDADAFAALLKRHGPMVLGVCRGVLHDLHDAEDAFQAAFVLLAQKAGSIHRREAVGAWLYRVAYRVAVRARAGAARRRVIEQKAVTMPPADPVLDLSLREVRTILFEELESLPEPYRAPLVLCALEEKSLEESARLLGWTRGAVKWRLQRGRQLLRACLRRRGLEVPAALSAVALAPHSSPGRVAAALTDSTLRAVVQVAAGGGLAGAASAEVTALIQGASNAMFSGKVKIATALLLVASAALAAFGVARHRARAADRPPPAPGPAEQPHAPPGAEATVEVRGQVLDPEGKPVTGATLYLSKPTGLAGTSTGCYLQGPVPARVATSGPDGRFRFSVARSEAEPGVAEGTPMPAQVMAVAAGHGCAWAKLGPAATELSLRLVQDVPINGRILDTDGKPVAGARLTVARVAAPPGGDLGSTLAAVRKGEPYASAGDWAGPLPGRSAVLTTGGDGRFRLAGVGRERIVDFRVEGPAIASTFLGSVMTRAAEKIVVAPDVAGPYTRVVYGASFDFVARPSRPIRGVVRDKETGKPLARASVEGKPTAYQIDGDCKTLTDKDGRYELLGMPKMESYWLVVKPADGLRFQRQVEVRDPPGLDALTADVELLRGLTVRGRVTDRETGKPVAQARVDYHPLFGNPNVGTLADIWPVVAETTTDRDGSYALTVLPGPGVIGVTGPRPEAYMPAAVTFRERKAFFKTPIPPPHNDGLTTVLRNFPYVMRQEDYNAFALLEPGAKSEGLVKDVALQPPQAVKGRLVGPDGRPLTGVTAFGLVRFGKETLPGAEFTVRGVNPPAKRPVVFYHPDRDLRFFAAEWRSGPDGPLTVKLQPCGSASGRVLDQDGQPVAGLRIDIWGTGLGGLGFGADTHRVTTDREGRFRAPGLVPGQQYWVELSRSPQSRRFVAVESGKNKELGDIKAFLGN
jgi:RNA polymerase sigma factor (sigma-70 family)